MRFWSVDLVCVVTGFADFCLGQPAMPNAFSLVAERVEPPFQVRRYEIVLVVQ